MNSDRLPIKSYPTFISDKKTGLFFHKRKYVIPVYQRPYSWTEEHLDDFLKTILDGYANHEDKFFGTMQMNVSNRNNENEEYQIVDGQQRLLTFMLCFKVLEIIIGEEFIGDIGVSISMRNDRKAEENLNAILSCKRIEEVVIGKKGKVVSKDFTNNFDANIRMLKHKLSVYYNMYCEESTDNKDDLSFEQYCLEIKNYIINSIYVVVLETEDDSRMSLAQIVSIFNTINKTGMDLGEDDVFKIRYFDYLRKRDVSKEKTDEQWMQELNENYELIETYNHNKPKKEKVEMNWVLDIYKHCICAKYKLQTEMLLKSNESFFECIFDNHENFTEILDLKEFSIIVKLFLNLWQDIQTNNTRVKKVFYQISVNLIEQTRYGRYWTIPFIYLYFHRNNEEECCTQYGEALAVSFAVFRWLSVNSVTYSRTIYPVHNIMCNQIFQRIKADDAVRVIPEYVNSIIWKTPYNLESMNSDAKITFEGWLQKDSFTNKRIGLMCLLVAIQKEIDCNTSTEEIKRKFFNKETSPYHIEHIFSQSLFKNWSEEKIKKYNSIGNLVLLEADINTEMGRNRILSPATKVSYYQNTNFKVAEEVKKSLDSWNEQCIESRINMQRDILLRILGDTIEEIQ